MQTTYTVSANSAGEARTIATNRAQADGWKLITSVYVTPVTITTFNVTITTGGLK
jgi:hypothetical protein